jgi:hypothetical protein
MEVQVSQTLPWPRGLSGRGNRHIRSHQSTAWCSIEGWTEREEEALVLSQRPQSLTGEETPVLCFQGYMGFTGRRGALTLFPESHT